MTEISVEDRALLPPERHPSSVRFLIVAITAMAAVLLYLHRFCMAYVQQFMKEDLGIGDQQMAWCLSAFFFSYALAQVPSGWLGDRFGARTTLTAYIAIWSTFAVFMGLTTGFIMLLVIRLGAGIGQAGAYPTSASILSKWAPVSFRGAASSIVSLGGRVGGAIAPLATGYLVLWFVPLSIDPQLTTADVLDPGLLHQQLQIDDKQTDPTSRARNGIVLRLREENLLPLPSDSSSPEDAVAVLNPVLLWTDLYSKEAFEGIKLERETTDLLAEMETSTLSKEKLQRLNRLLIESAFPQTVRKLYVHGWRPTMMTLGSLGVIVALVFWVLHRNRPDLHPWCNQAEVDMIQAGKPRSASQTVGAIPWSALLKHRGINLLCVSQFGTNVGWVFLVTLLPAYLLEVHNVPYEERNWMATVPLLVGWFGMIGGGYATDFLAKRISPRWSRTLPMAGSRFLAMGAFLFCLFDISPWVATLLFAVVAFATDFGSAPLWAFNQDVGGQHVGSVLGWGNMWGNLGAAVSPPLLQYVAQNGGWEAAFLTCAGAFLVAGICGSWADASIPLIAEEN